MILIDTQVLIWSALGIELGSRSRSRLDEAQSDTGLFMSPISAWEIAMLVEKGRLSMAMPVGDWIAQAARDHDLRWAPLTTDIAIDAGSLRGGIHGDPADRLIIATARSLGCPVMTADRKLLAYAAAGHVGAIDARD